MIAYIHRMPVYQKIIIVDTVYKGTLLPPPITSKSQGVRVDMEKISLNVSDLSCLVWSDLA